MRLFISRQPVIAIDSSTSNTEARGSCVRFCCSSISSFYTRQCFWCVALATQTYRSWANCWQPLWREKLVSRSVWQSGGRKTEPGKIHATIKRNLPTVTNDLPIRVCENTVFNCQVGHTPRKRCETTTIKSIKSLFLCTRLRNMRTLEIALRTMIGLYKNYWRIYFSNII